MYSIMGSHSGTLMYSVMLSHSGTLMYSTMGSHSGTLMYKKVGRAKRCRMLLLYCTFSVPEWRLQNAITILYI